ncbi:MAG: DUF3822 family protein, partial [Flavobacteriaceae bacterium]|nr:DUF3822 family protein [Flavobacteriaceae bacterium]
DESSLLFYNMFEVETQEDLIYHLLFTMQQLGLDVEETPVRIMGGIEQHDHNFEIVYKYVRDVDFLDTSDFLNNNNLSEKELRNNFILLNSFS